MKLLQPFATVIIHAVPGSNQYTFEVGKDLLSASVTLSKDDNSSSCQCQVYDPGLTILNDLLSTYQKQGGILVSTQIQQPTQDDIAPIQEGSDSDSETLDNLKTVTSTTQADQTIATMKVLIGFNDGSEPKTFEYMINKVSGSYFPDMLEVFGKCIRYKIAQSVRTDSQQNTSLRQVAENIASNNGSNLEIERSYQSEQNIPIVNQQNQTDYSILMQLASKLGYSVQSSPLADSNGNYTLKVTPNLSNTKPINQLSSNYLITQNPTGDSQTLITPMVPQVSLTFNKTNILSASFSEESRGDTPRYTVSPVAQPGTATVEQNSTDEQLPAPESTNPVENVEAAYPATLSLYTYPDLLGLKPGDLVSVDRNTFSSLYKKNTGIFISIPDTGLTPVSTTGNRELSPYEKLANDESLDNLQSKTIQESVVIGGIYSQFEVSEVTHNYNAGKLTTTVNMFLSIGVGSVESDDPPPILEE